MVGGERGTEKERSIPGKRHGGSRSREAIDADKGMVCGSRKKNLNRDLVISMCWIRVSQDDQI